MRYVFLNSNNKLELRTGGAVPALGFMLTNAEYSAMCSGSSLTSPAYLSWLALHQPTPPDSVYPASPLPIKVTPWQIRKALNQSGLRGSVEADIAQADATTKDGWEFAQEFLRDDPLVVALGVALGRSENELDDLFILAQSL